MASSCAAHVKRRRCLKKRSKNHKFLPLKVREAPVELPKMTQVMQWHKYHTHKYRTLKYRTQNPGLVWLRGLQHQAVKRMDGG